MKFHSLSYGITAAAVVVSCMVPMRVVAQAVSGSAPQDGIHAPLPKSAAEAAIKAAEAKPTPRTADGHPDLNGYWDSAANALTPRKSGHEDANGNVILGVVDPIPVTLRPRLLVDPNPPPYKPELLAKVKYLAAHGIDTDPEWKCIPNGVPRAGAPRQIVQTPKLIVFMYQDDIARADSRLIPTDGRPHRTDVDPSYNGDSIGHWEGDTLVVDVNQLSDETFLESRINGYQSGYFHSDALHVVERITRKGDALRWEATVEDPKVLTKPWIVTPQTKVLSDDAIYEQPICVEREAKHMVDRY
jgi:hypothetical protein